MLIIIFLLNSFVGVGIPRLRITPSQMVDIIIQKLYPHKMVASDFLGIPSGKHTKNDGTSPFLMGKSTISMAMFNSKVSAITRGYPIPAGNHGRPWMVFCLCTLRRKEGGLQRRWGRLIGFSGNQA